MTVNPAAHDGERKSESRHDEIRISARAGNDNALPLTYSHMIDPHSFREFEHSGWQGIPQQYHQAFGELTTQSIEPLLDAAGVKAGTKVIDIASGPGYVAAAAARRGATVIGVDFSAAMVAEAQRAQSRDRVSRRRRGAIAVRR